MGHLYDILKKRAPVVNVFKADDSTAAAARAMAERQVGAILVVDEGRLVGIFSERDLLRRVVAVGRDLQVTYLREVMTRNPITASPDDERMSAIVKMQAIGCRHLPIVLEGQIVDTVSIRDLLFHEIKERDDEIQELRRYIQGT